MVQQISKVTLITQEVNLTTDTEKSCKPKIWSVCGRRDRRQDTEEAAPGIIIDNYHRELTDLSIIILLFETRNVLQILL